METILVPTDFSPTAEKALHFALHLARHLKAGVTIYHIFAPLESTFVDTAEQRKQYNDEARQELLTRLERLRKKMEADYQEVPMQIALGRMPLTATLLDYAREHAVDLIVMGTQGASGLRKWLIGTVASGVAAHAQAPVLLVPEKYEWREPGQVAFATNYDACEKEALEKAIRIAGSIKAQLTIVHLCPTGKDSQEQQVRFLTFAEGMQKKYNKVPLRFEAITCKELKEGMEHLDEHLQYDILVMVRREKDLMERMFSTSYTRTMTYASHRPLLIMPACQMDGNNDSALASQEDATNGNV